MAVSGVNSVGLQTTQLLVAMAGAILWATILSGMIERRNGRDHIHRLPLRINLTFLAMGGEVTGEDLAIIENGQLACQGEHIIGAPRFV